MSEASFSHGLAMLSSAPLPLRSEQSAGSGTREDRGIVLLTAMLHESQKRDDEDDVFAEDDSERIQRGRERNREHARRTRLRKKAQLQELQGKYREMIAERTQLQQQLQERRIASILLGLSTSAPLTNDDAMEEDSLFVSPSTATIPTSRRKRGFPELAPSNSSSGTIHIHGLAIPSKSHINWKTGIYSDELGRPKQMTPQQLEDLRRERNRMHAKMTRDRKKCFVATMEKAIDDLEQELSGLRGQLLLPHEATAVNNNLVTPELTARPSPPSASSSQRCSPLEETSLKKRTDHGFSLDE